MVRGRAPRPLTPWQASSLPRAQPKGHKPFRMWSCWGAGFQELGNLAARGPPCHMALARHSLQQAQLDCGTECTVNQKLSSLSCLPNVAFQANLPTCPLAVCLWTNHKPIARGLQPPWACQVEPGMLGVAARGHLCFSGWARRPWALRGLGWDTWLALGVACCWLAGLPKQIPPHTHVFKGGRGKKILYRQQGKGIQQ